MISYDTITLLHLLSLKTRGLWKTFMKQLEDAEKYINHLRTTVRKTNTCVFIKVLAHTGKWGH